MSELIPALELDEGTEADYTLNEGWNSVWLTIGNITVYVRRTSTSDVVGGVVVELYPRGREDQGQQLGETYAFFSDAKAAIEEAKGDGGETVDPGGA